MGESQKVTPFWAPPDREAAVSGRHNRLPDESVDNLPLLDSPEQLYDEILTGLLTVNDPPIPTLPVRLDRPDTFKLLPIPTKPLKYPVPATSSLYWGLEVPIPNLKLVGSQ